jgi:hypothetical protein
MQKKHEVVYIEHKRELLLVCTFGSGVKVGDKMQRKRKLHGAAIYSHTTKWHKAIGWRRDKILLLNVRL